MKSALSVSSFLAAGIVALAGDPEHLAFRPEAAHASQLICSSTNYESSYCRSGVGGARVQIADQLSRAPCIEGRTWGYGPRGIWVDRGCAARFAYRSGASSSDVASAAIVGGLIGALLGSTSDHSSDRRNDYYDRTPRYSRPYPVVVEHRAYRERDTSQDVDRSVQKFDKDGNPNYDANGAYQGAHGIGALVDNPDAPSADEGGPNK